MNNYPTTYGQMMYNPSYYQQPLQKIEVTRVNGRDGAEAYQLAPNSSVLLLDATEPIVWLKITDGAGYPTVTPYKIEPYQEITQESLEMRLSKIEERLAAYESNSTESKQNTNERKPQQNKTSVQYNQNSK